MFVVEIFVIGLLTIGIFLTAVAVPIFIKKKTTTIDDLDEILAGLNEPLALSPKQEQYQKVKEKNKQNSPNAYPDSTLFQFSKKETDDAFTRLTSNIRKEYSTDGHVFTVKVVEDPDDVVVDTDNFYVWGQEEPIYSVSRYYRYETPKEYAPVEGYMRYYVVWNGREVYLMCGRDYPNSTEAITWGALTPEQFNISHKAADFGLIDNFQRCTDIDTYIKYITNLYDYNHSLRNAVEKYSSTGKNYRRTI